jgi:tetratricopeptide (TPR) repeat protein
LTIADPFRELERARHQAQVLGNVVRALELLGGVFSSGDLEARHHVRRLLPSLLARLDPGHDPAGVLARTGLPAPRGGPATVPSATVAPAARIGAAWSLLVDRDASSEPFLALLSVGTVPAPGPRPLALTPASAAAIDRADQAVVARLLEQRRFSPRRILHRRVVELRVGPAPSAGDLPAVFAGLVDGASIGAPAALALHSLLTRSAVPGDIASSGDVTLDGRIGPVAEIGAKVRAALRERPSLRAIFVPAGSPLGEAAADRRVRPVGTVAELLDAVFGEVETCPALEAIDLEETCRLGEELYEREGDDPAALAVMRRLLAALDADAALPTPAPAARRIRFRALWRAGAALSHLGGVEEASRLFDRASRLGRELFDAAELDPRLYLGFLGSQAVLLRDSGRLAEAEVLLQGTIALQTELRQEARERARTLGNLGELLSIAGRLDEAERHLRGALELLRATYPDEVPRELCYLGDLMLRRGDPDRAIEVYREGLDANAPVERGREANEEFLRHGLARALLEAARPLEAIALCDALLEGTPESRPYPRQLVQKTRGLSRLRLGETEAGRADLLAAADLRHARGELLRFGLSTALAPLAIDLLAVDRAGALAAARRFLEAAEGSPELAGPGLLARTRRLLEAEPLDPAALAAALEELARAFPYG